MLIELTYPKETYNTTYAIAYKKYTCSIKDIMNNMASANIQYLKGNIYFKGRNFRVGFNFSIFFRVILFREDLISRICSWTKFRED